MGNLIVRLSNCKCLCFLLTGLNFECEGVLLLDGLCIGEAGITAVVCVSILIYNVGKVQVSIQTHGHSLILRDCTHSWKTKEEQREREMEKGKES